MEEKNKIIITKMTPPNCQKEALVSCMTEGDRLSECYFEDLQSGSEIGTIYVGKVQNIVKNINAAFISISKDETGYYPLEELPTAIFTKKQGKKPLVIGDELLVQVAKDPVKKKMAVLTTNLNFSGKYFVFTTGKKGIGTSSKLSLEEKESLKRLVRKTLLNGETDFFVYRYGLIVRTNAGEASEEQLVSELKNMELRLDELLKKAAYRPAFSQLTNGQREYFSIVRNAYQGQMDEIVTDDEGIYQELLEYLRENQAEDADKLIFYQDALLPLYKLYNMPLQLERALKPHVWLKSGAYLVIEQTEMCTVIDVNTGKFDGKKKKEDAVLKVNIEAAKEIARQMRLRNLSGMILVDFINMGNEEDIELLLDRFREFVKLDRIKTVVVDITALGIVEVTRKKERICLAESLKQFQ